MGPVRAQIGHLWSAELVTLGLGVAQGACLARGLGARQYGLYAVITTFTALIFVVLDPRGADAVSKYTATFRSTGDWPAVVAVLKGAFLLDLLFGAAAAVIAVSLTGLLPVLGVAGNNGNIVVIAALGALVAVPVSSGRATLGAFARFRTIARIQVSVAIVRAGVLIPVAFFLDVRAVFIALSAVAAVEGTAYLVIANRVAVREFGVSLWAAQLAALKGHGRGIASFLAYADAGTLTGSFIKQMDVIAVSTVTDSTTAGYYRLAKSLTVPAASVGMPIQAVLFPRVASAVANNDATLAASLFKRTFLWAAVPLAVGALLAIPLCGPVIGLLAGPEFSSAVGLAHIMMVGVALSFITLPLRPLYLALGYNAAFAWTGAFTALIAVSGFILMGPLWGAVGIAWARAISAGTGAATLFIVKARFVRRQGYAHAPKTRPKAFVPPSAMTPKP